MDPVYLYVALLDVLAYRWHLERDRSLGTLDFQARLSSALKVFDGVNDAVFRVQAISDTIIITCLGHQHFPQFMSLLRDVFLAFLEQQLFVRGAVAYSRHFQSSHLTYSHALARAYEIESSLAVYPRIVIDENIVRMYEVGSGLPPIRSTGLLCEENDIFFLNVLTKDNWSEVHASAKAIYEASAAALHSSEAVFTKYLRFERYLLASPHAPPGACRFTRGIELA
jgi:hypothetical protein